MGLDGGLGGFVLGRDVLSLFLEATQLKTERTAIVVLRVDPSVAEVQVVGIATPRRNRRRPDAPGVADAPQRSFAAAANARGRAVLSLFLEAAQLKTVRTAIAALRADPSVAEAQGAGIATPRRNRRRPDVPGVADVIQRTVLISAEARGRAHRAFYWPAGCNVLRPRSRGGPAMLRIAGACRARKSTNPALGMGLTDEKALSSHAERYRIERKKVPIDEDRDLLGNFVVGVRRFELPTSTSRTWRANRTVLHPENSECKYNDILGIPPNFRANIFRKK